MVTSYILREQIIDSEVKKNENDWLGERESVNDNDKD